MKNLVSTLFTLSLVAGATLAHAQVDIPLTQPRFIAAVSPAYKKSLNLTDRQEKDILSELDGIVQVEGDRVMVRMVGGTEPEDLDKRVIKILSETQQKRLEELWLQMNGYMALSDKKTAERLGLEEDQLKQLQGLFDEHSRKMEELFAPTDGQVRIDGDKLHGLKKETEAKIAKLLNEDQKKKWDAMLGEKVVTKDRDGGEPSRSPWVCPMS